MADHNPRTLLETEQARKGFRTKARYGDFIEFKSILNLNSSRVLIRISIRKQNFCQQEKLINFRKDVSRILQKFTNSDDYSSRISIRILVGNAAVADYGIVMEFRPEVWKCYEKFEKKFDQNTFLNKIKIGLILSSRGYK